MSAVRAALLLPAMLIASNAMAQGQADAVSACRPIVAAADRAAGAQNNVAGADYVPGIDMRGNAVAPADLSPRITLPDELVLSVQPDVFAYLGMAPPRGLPELRAPIGELRIRLSDGQASFNSQALGPTADKELVDACRALLAGAPPAPR